MLYYIRVYDIQLCCLTLQYLILSLVNWFYRKSRLNRKGMTNAAIDILYIDMQRKWETVRMDRTAGQQLAQENKNIL